MHTGDNPSPKDSARRMYNKLYRHGALESSKKSIQLSVAV